MQSFRTELENPLVEKDIIELEKKIRLFREGKIHEEKFRSLRLARGVYGQRQRGVQMVRIKLPFGKLSVKQLLRIADISDEYASHNLHLTTRQDIQIHYVSLDKTPELWAKLEQDEITLREACGNTVRNITASALAGIDPDEPFDVSPYAQEMFKYFLRNPVCQEMGRKIKIAFSSSEKDSAFTYMHDLGFIPRKKYEDHKEKRGFKVLIGGGLGAQPMLAKTAFEFLDEDLIIPYTEAVLRVFDRYGERTHRHKARLKFLVEKIGFDELIRLIELERPALKNQSVAVDYKAYPLTSAPAIKELEPLQGVLPAHFAGWLKTNTLLQKQKEFLSVYIKVPTGDLSTAKARELAQVIKQFASSDDIRITIGQNLLLKYVREQNLQHLFLALDKIGLADAGHGGMADITTCPGTDTCNLGIASSTGLTRELERVIHEEYPDQVFNTDIKIKISGCMNSCGQHGIANIGFHGCSLKSGKNVVPAVLVLLGGGTLGSGEGRIADKIIKVPAKRGPQVLRVILDDYEANAKDGEYFNDYYLRQGENYFYLLLKPLANLTSLEQADFIDWGHEETFETAIGVGECAGVVIDLVATLLFEADEKLQWAGESLVGGLYADSIYHSYNVFVSGAKALLLDKQVNCNTQNGILNDFNKHFEGHELFPFQPDFKTQVLQINQHQPTAEFATAYIASAEKFLENAKKYRGADKETAPEENKIVFNN
jgi:sulfite reductase (ferredoxin)